MRNAAKALLVVAGLLGIVSLLLHGAGFRVNVTSSYPKGLYILTGKPIVKGDLVIFCPPDNAVMQEAKRRGYIQGGFCPGGYGHLIKKVVAMQGDRVLINQDGVYVNGALVPNSRPLQKDLSGRPLPRPVPAQDHLGAGEVLLLSDYNPHSFDGRYWGVVQLHKSINIINGLLVLRLWPE